MTYLLFSHKVVPPPSYKLVVIPLIIDISPTKTIVTLELCEPQLSDSELGHHLAHYITIDNISIIDNISPVIYYI